MTQLASMRLHFLHVPLEHPWEDHAFRTRIFRGNSSPPPPTIKQVLRLLALVRGSHLPACPPRTEGSETREMCLPAHFPLARCVIAGFSEPEAEPGSPEEACSCAFTQLLNLILKNENHSLKCQLCSPVWGLAPGKTLVESRTVLHHRHSGSGILKCRFIWRLHIKHVCAVPTCLRYLGKTGISSGEQNVLFILRALSMGSS